MPNRKLQKSLKKFSNRKEERLITISGELGLPLNGQKLVEVPNRKGFVYVRLKNNTSEVIQAYNSEVSTIYGLTVLVARQNNIYKVIGRDLDRYKDWGSIPYLPKHGGQHSFNQAAGMGADITWIFSQQLMPLLGYPSGSNGSNGIVVAPYTVRDLNGNFKYIGNTGTPNISQYRPSIATGAVMVLVYVDTVSGNPYLLVGSGSYFHAGITGSADIAKYIPPVTNPNWIPDTAVRLTSGTTQLTWANLYDVRPFLQVFPTGSGGSSGGGGSGFGFVAWDEGVFLGTGTVLNFVGDNVQASISGSVVRVFVTGSSSGGGINTGTLDARYLKLDTSNDPLTGNLLIQPPSGTSGLTIVGVGDINVADFEHYAVQGYSAPSPTFFLNRSVQDFSSAFFSAPFIEAWQDTGVSGSIIGEFLSLQSNSTQRISINPAAQGTGTLTFWDGDYTLSPDGMLLLLKNHGSPRFYVNASGTAYSNNVPLIKEAPVNGLSYVRKNAGWELSVTGSSGAATNPPITGSFVIQENGATLGSALILNAGSNITATLSGTTAMLDANTVLLKTDDFTSQINGVVTTFGPTAFLPDASTARLFYNGIRQRYLFHYNISGSYVQTLYTPTTGSVLLLDYNESSTTGTLNSVILVQDEGVTKGSATTMNFVGAGVQANVSGLVATVTITGSAQDYFKQAESGTVIAVSGTTNEVTLYSGTFNGGLLGTNGSIYLDSIVEVNHAVVGTVTLKLYYGSQSVSLAIAEGAVTPNKPGRISFRVGAKGLTNSQIVEGQAHLKDGTVFFFKEIMGFLTVDSTTSQRLQFTAQWGGSNNGLAYTQHHLNIGYYP